MTREIVNETINKSELVRMAEKFFDEESVKEMVQELKDDLCRKLGLPDEEDEN